MKRSGEAFYESSDSHAQHLVTLGVFVAADASHAACEIAGALEVEPRELRFVAGDRGDLRIDIAGDVREAVAERAALRVHLRARQIREQVTRRAAQGRDR